MTVRPTIVIALLLLLAPAPAGMLAAPETASTPPIDSRDFFERFSATAPIKRDGFLDEHLNRVLRSRGYVVSVDERARYNRRIRIIATERATSRINVTYYIYADRRSALTALKKNAAFDFSGLFTVYTPLSSRRDSYLFDIVLIEGAAAAD